MILNRQKVLLNVIHGLNSLNIHSRRAIVKSLFLLKTEYFLDSQIKFYNFFPYKQGPFSQLCYSDLRKLKKDGLIDADETSVTKEGKFLGMPASNQFAGQLSHLLGRFSSEAQLTRYVYAKYPKYTIRSELVKKSSATQAHGKGYCTIGYQKKDIDTFLNLLIQNEINTVVDVRNNPYSMNFCFIKKYLEKFLNDAGIKYVHIPELGVRHELRNALESKEDYEDLFLRYRSELDSKSEYLKKVIDLGTTNKVALLCFEEDVSSCHRREIASYLRNHHCEVCDL